MGNMYHLNVAFNLLADKYLMKYVENIFCFYAE